MNTYNCNCNCTLRAVTGDTKCCENCTNNTLRTIYGNTRINIGDPARHGHWVAERAYFSNDPDSEFIEYKCSECASYVLYEEYLPNYCQHCGAKMDGKDGEQDEQG